MLDNNKIQDYKLMGDTLRFLCADMVQEANSGHPGAPMGLADIAVVLSEHIKLNPKQPEWINRDRLVFSGGHASALLYSLLHLWGFDVSLDDLKNFRKLNSKTPGHPEYKHTKGVDITTGPLGQGVANAVGFAMASKMAQNILGSEIISHNVYCLCGDGDLQEGISYEACSLAGHHCLDNLILIYDSNHITIEGDTSIAWSEDIKMRFCAQAWNVIEIDGHNFYEIDNALIKAKSSNKPTLIIANTTIAKGSVNLSGSHKAHGAPLGDDEIRESKIALGFEDKKFDIKDSVAIRFANVSEIGLVEHKRWEESLKNNPKKSMLDSMFNPDFSSIIYPKFTKDMATRVSNGEILNAISKALPGFVGGSADLAPSNNTELKNSGDFPNGVNLHYGIREHAMGAISNALANYGIFIPFSATFFVFSDYLLPSVRIASLMKSREFYIWTHDSIGVGEDGATHQPIEQISHYRSMPNFYLFRPADANENIACWQVALNLNSPCGFVLSRQNLPLLDEVSTESLKYGAYIKQDSKEPKVTLLASGSEVHIALRSAESLNNEGISTRVVSVPCYDLLLEQDLTYINSLFSGYVVAIEASRGLEWYKFAHKVIGMNGFGASANGEVLFDYFGFSVENITNIIKQSI
ncbi:MULTISPECIES: transketolase [Helicobacter]|uniref:Transketolase n=1 Tax=Helicobacter ibis TaxID=2962633 RepID=A0ABT4VD89_9HELI|nr:MULTISPECIES: transketolase [Helicobacter]MDA3967260.1 transketolase [Helicobacter sp. WB40]MDA3968672.1 transketolase [Helicobacter ibis]